MKIEVSTLENVNVTKFPRLANEMRIYSRMYLNIGRGCGRSKGRRNRENGIFWTMWNNSWDCKLKTYDILFSVTTAVNRSIQSKIDQSKLENRLLHMHICPFYLLWNYFKNLLL